MEIKGKLFNLMKPILPSYFKYLQLQALNVEDGDATFLFLIHIFQRFRMSVHDFQVKAPPGPGRMEVDYIRKLQQRFPSHLRFSHRFPILSYDHEIMTERTKLWMQTVEMRLSLTRCWAP